MYRNSRTEVPEFAEDESLYQRYRADHCLDDRFTPAAFRFPKQSVNRERFSKPEWVLFSEEGQYDREGVMAYTKRDIPSGLKNGIGKLYRFFPRHQPLDDNYSHSEIWHDPDPDDKPSERVRKAYRIHLAQRARIIIAAGSYRP